MDTYWSKRGMKGLTPEDVQHPGRLQAIFEQHHTITAMTARDLRIEIGTLLEREQDASILEAIRNLLRKTTLDPTLREKLTSRALQAEQEIKSGQGHTRHELEQDTDHLTRE